MAEPDDAETRDRARLDQIQDELQALAPVAAGYDYSVHDERGRLEAEAETIRASLGLQDPRPALRPARNTIVGWSILAGSIALTLLLVLAFL